VMSSIPVWTTESTSPEPHCCSPRTNWRFNSYEAAVSNLVQVVSFLYFFITSTLLQYVDFDWHSSPTCTEPVEACCYALRLPLICQFGAAAMFTHKVSVNKIHQFVEWNNHMSIIQLTPIVV
jgi:hypothetical protein